MKYLTHLLCIMMLTSYAYYIFITDSLAYLGTAYFNQSNNQIHTGLEYLLAEDYGIESSSQGAKQSDIKSVSVKLSYNPDKSDMITKELLDNVQREITTTFIGSGYRYSTENNSDMTINAFLDLDISTYEQHSTIIYDIVSKITLKAIDNKNNNLLKELTKNIFLSGNHLDEIILNSSRKSSSIAAKELIDKLEPLIENNKSLEGKALSLKIEIIFQGDSNYKYFNHINNLLLKSPYNLKLIKRTFDPGELFSLIVISRVESDILANYIQENSPSFTNLELEASQKNKLIFNIVNEMK